MLFGDIPRQPHQELLELSALDGAEGPHELDIASLQRPNPRDVAAAPAPRRNSRCDLRSSCASWNSRLAETRISPCSYFWMTWKLMPRARPTSVWVRPLSSRASRN